MLRFLDIVFAAVGLLLSLPVLTLLLVLGFFDTGAPIFLQTRVGRQQRAFVLVKFRTMRPDTPSVASHLVDATGITSFGRFLRLTKLDELPQLWNVLRGDMSLVGPRPCLFNQIELIEARERRGVFSVRPGITGLAQVSGVDMSTPQRLAEIDEQMLKRLDVRLYLRLILLTVLGRGAGDGVSGKN